MVNNVTQITKPCNTINFDSRSKYIFLLIIIRIDANVKIHYLKVISMKLRVIFDVNNIMIL